MPASLVRTTADYAVPAAVAWSDVPGMAIAVVAGTEYYFEFSLLVAASPATIGHTIAVNGPASPTYLRYSWSIPTGAAAISLGGSNVYDHAVAVPAASASASTTAPTVTLVTGLLVPSAAGTLACRVKPEGAGVTVVRGSWGVVSS